MIFEAVKNNYNKIPKVVKLFLLKALVIFIIWQFSYHVYLQKIRVPDNFLTNITAISTAKLISFYYPNTQVLYNTFKAIISINGTKIIGIADPCNALEIYVLYVTFLICFPASNKRRLLFLLGGFPCIFVANVVRCVIITWLNISHRGWVDIAHHYVFTSLVYIMVFYLWVLFSKGGVVKK